MMDSKCISAQEWLKTNGERLAAAVDKHRERIIAAEDYIWANPETGFREIKTSKYMEDAFEALGYELVKAGDIPGFYTVLDTGRPGPEVLVLGELDSLICPQHPESDPETGAVHCCGHSAQCAALIGLAAALKEPGILDDLSGRIRLCAVPAEETIEVEYREALRKSGRIHYLGGKSEFMYRGYFDGVDLAFMVHTGGEDKFEVRQGSVGCVVKRIVYKGVSAHAGGAPWDGCNALYAATIGLNAVNAIRETFKDTDQVRVHPIITKGGTAVNAIPDRVVLESYVRGNTMEVMREANDKVNRALCGGALCLGANIDIQDIACCAPLRNSKELLELIEEAAGITPEVLFVRHEIIGTGSTDMGDLSCVMPVIHPYAPGATGTSHGSDYYISNPDLACVTSAKWQLSMLALLLKDDAARAKQVVAEYQSPFASKEAYFKYMDSFYGEGDRIAYDREAAIVRL